MAQIKFPCPNCKKTLNAPAELAGKGRACPNCKAKFKVPLPQAKANVPSTSVEDLSQGISYRCVFCSKEVGAPQGLKRPNQCPHCSEWQAVPALVQHKCFHCQASLEDPPLLSNTLKQCPNCSESYRVPIKTRYRCISCGQICEAACSLVGNDAKCQHCDSKQEVPEPLDQVLPQDYRTGRKGTRRTLENSILPAQVIEDLRSQVPSQFNKSLDILTNQGWTQTEICCMVPEILEMVYAWPEDQETLAPCPSADVEKPMSKRLWKKLSEVVVGKSQDSARGQRDRLLEAIRTINFRGFGVEQAYRKAASTSDATTLLEFLFMFDHPATCAAPQSPFPSLAREGLWKLICEGAYECVVYCHLGSFQEPQETLPATDAFHHAASELGLRILSNEEAKSAVIVDYGFSSCSKAKYDKDIFDGRLESSAEVHSYEGFLQLRGLDAHCFQFHERSNIAYSGVTELERWTQISWLGSQERGPTKFSEWESGSLEETLKIFRRAPYVVALVAALGGAKKVAPRRGSFQRFLFNEAAHQAGE